jgi:cysteine-rich secretory family protein
MRLRTIAVALMCCALSSVAVADIDKGVNALRQRGCEGKPGVRETLRRSRGLDEVAREWSKGGRLHQAIAKTDYRVANSSSMQIEGAKSEQALLQIIASNYCETVLSREFTEIGVYEQRDTVWIVVALPLTLPQADDMPKVAARVLELVNEARASARNCGSRSFPKVPPLKLSPVLSRAALAHAKDMSEHKLFEHRGSDGSMPADRALRAGYDWLAVGENIAEGAANAEVVVQGWLHSPGHCVNIMSPQYQEMGLAYFTDFAHKGDIYWAQTFGTEKKK